MTPFATPFFDAARLLVQAMWFSDVHETFFYHGQALVWRHHGLGMLQAEFSEELRVHVWHPSLVVPGMAWPRCVHDHRFDITSAVITGEIIDVPCSVHFEDPSKGEVIFEWEKPVNVYEIEHAKNQDEMVGKGCSTATSARLLAKGGLRGGNYVSRIPAGAVVVAIPAPVTLVAVA